MSIKLLPLLKLSKPCVRPLAEFFQIASGVVQAIGHRASSRKWRRIPGSERRARGRRVVQAHQIPVKIDAAPEKLCPAGNKNKIDIAGRVLSAHRSLKEPVGIDRGGSGGRATF
jgi:hypothetical protein